MTKPDDKVTSTIESLLKANSTYSIVPSSDNKSGIITYRDIISLLGEQTQDEIPVYIIGMPEDPFEAELIKSKFHNIVKHLNRISPKIEEARCKIKIKDIEGEKKDTRCLLIYLQHTGVMYILQIKNDMSEGLKNQVAHKKDERQKDSTRHSYD